MLRIAGRSLKSSCRQCRSVQNYSSNGGINNFYQNGNIPTRTTIPPRRTVLLEGQQGHQRRRKSSSNSNSNNKGTATDTNKGTTTTTKLVTVTATPTHLAVGAALMCFAGAAAAQVTFGNLLSKGGSMEKNGKPRGGGPRRDASTVRILLDNSSSSSSSTTGDGGDGDDDNASKKKKTSILPKLKQQQQQQQQQQQDMAPKDDGEEESQQEETQRHHQQQQQQQKLQYEVTVQEFEQFVQDQRQVLQTARQDAKTKSQQQLERELRDALSDCTTRGVKTFSDWYFAYTTTYNLLQIAMTSAAKHVLRLSPNKKESTVTDDDGNKRRQSLQEAVTRDIQTHVSEKYLALVLRPAITDPKLHRAYVRCVRASHEDYLNAVAALEESVATFVRKHGSSIITPPAAPPTNNTNNNTNNNNTIGPDDVLLELDWTAQLQKVEHVPTTYERSAHRTLAVVGTGAVAGKVAGGAAVGAAAKAVSAKLAAPFATKAVAAVASGSAGAAAGSAIAGPIGLAAGTAIGLSVDVTLNAGVALIKRPALEADLKESLEATRMEWEDRLWPELERVQTIWFDQAEAMLRVEEGGEEEIGSSRDAGNDIVKASA